MQEIRIVLDDPECLRDIRGPHVRDVSNLLNPATERELNDDFTARFPHVHLRRAVFAR